MGGGIRIGTAGWSIPAGCAEAFPGEGSHLQRYAARLNAVEINSSFYRPHRPGTYARWAASVPSGFRFAVKMPREITHRRKLIDVAEPLKQFLAEIGHLGAALGPVLVQLPPSLRYDAAAAGPFIQALREWFEGAVVLEPRHRSWFTAEVEEQLAHHRIARVAADPASVPQAAEPGGWPGLVYRRLHGSPKMYYSAYSEETLDDTARLMRLDTETARESWCIFDNTALGAACENALGLLWRLRSA